MLPSADHGPTSMLSQTKVRLSQLKAAVVVVQTAKLVSHLTLLTLTS